MTALVVPPSSIDPNRRLLPWVSAALLALGYLVIAGVYIVMSSDIASSRTYSVEELHRMEAMKGLMFVVVTALALFVFNWVQLRRLGQRDEQLRRMDRALANADRQVIAGTLASAVAHDINNGLMVASIQIGELQELVAESPRLRHLAEDAQAALARIGEWNRRVFDIGRTKVLGEVREFDLAHSVRTSFDLAHRHQSMRTVTVDLLVPERLPFRGTEAIVQRAVLNLLLNAAEAAGPSSKLRLTLQHLGEGRHLIAVDDSGPGVPEALRARILEPFFTTKAGGTGLGIASVIACANLHHGTVRIEDSPLGGARFTLTIRPDAAVPFSS